MESILAEVKTRMGYPESYTPFDNEIIPLINMSMMKLEQLGVKPSDGFRVNGYDETWEQYLGGRDNDSMVRDYIYWNTKSMFDPAQNSNFGNTITEHLRELEWRIQREWDEY